MANQIQRGQKLQCIKATWRINNFGAEYPNPFPAAGPKSREGQAILRAPFKPTLKSPVFQFKACGSEEDFVKVWFSLLSSRSQRMPPGECNLGVAPTFEFDGKFWECAKYEPTGMDVKINLLNERGDIQTGPKDNESGYWQPLGADDVQQPGLYMCWIGSLGDLWDEKDLYFADGTFRVRLTATIFGEPKKPAEKAEKEEDGDKVEETAANRPSMLRRFVQAVTKF